MMTSVARGRGWGSTQDKGVPLRRPGELTVPPDMTEVDSLIAAVQGINLHDANDSVVMLRGVEELMKGQCLTEESLRSVVQRLHDRSLEDRQFGMKAAAAYATVSQLEVAGIKLRNVLLQAVQKDYENRAHLQTSSNSKFLNAIALLGEIFHRVRLPDGSPIQVLATAVLQYQDMLLAGEEHEMELFTTQLAVNGRKLYDFRPTELEELMLRVRTTLMSRNLSGQCRCWLLLALDLAANRYAPLSGPLQSFYQVHLGANAIKQLQRIQLSLTVDVANSRSPSNDAPNSTKSSGSSENKSNGGEADGILAKCKVEEPVKNLTVENGVIIRPSVKVVTGFEAPKRTSGEGVGYKKVTSPVEERGHSGFDSAKTGGGTRKFNSHDKTRKKSWRKEDNPNEDIWGSARGEKSQSWGHDDRFTKDDDYYGKQAQRGEGTSRPRNKDSTSGNWRDRKSSESKEQKSSTKVSKAEPTSPTAKILPPSLPDDEENWD
ncbi:hypothetical protein C0J52_12292 [Blattella germanica]|nr:hypothetical protein C0J52_12292 [Blattella germanica]